MSGGPGRVAPASRNVLRPSGPRLRIRIRLGDLDQVFDPVNTVLGKKQRLQAVGWYYEVITAAAANTATEAYTNCLAAWRAERERARGSAFANDAAVETDLQAQIRLFVVDGGNLPAARNRVRLYQPGALTFNTVPQLGDGGSADGAALPSERFNDEGSLWTGNTALGKIPIIATVEEEHDGAWRPSRDRRVHFQLVAPFHDSAANELDFVNALRNSSEQAAGPPPTASNIVPNVGPRTFITNAMNHNFDANNPQRYNAHTSRGGKRGAAALLGSVFEALPAAFAGMSAPQASTRPHAVRVQTNNAGEAGVLFRPSRMAGDRYRLRIFVDPIGTVASDGTGATAVAHETGRFVALKHILFSRFLRKPMPVLPAVNTAIGMQARLSILGYDVGPLDDDWQNRSREALRAFQHNNHPPLPTSGASHGDRNHAATQAALDAAVTDYIDNTCGQALGNLDFAAMREQFRQMYCVLADGPAQATADMTEADYQAALRWARTQAHANQAAYGLSQRYNVEVMIEDTFNTPYLFEIRHPRFYNRTRGPGVPQASPAANFADYWDDAAVLIYSRGGLLHLFLRFITGNASAAAAPTANLTRYSTPGLTVVRTLAASRLMFPPNQPGQVQLPAATPRTGASGIATPERACVVFYGRNLYNDWPYQGDGYTKNTMHEMGHTLYLRHHRTQVGGLHAQASFREDHDDTDRCLMGYLYCEGEFCGKCHLKLRGWDISQMPV